MNQSNRIDLNILILTLPLSGHQNPLASLAHELVTKRNARVIFYGNLENKDFIEKSKAEFRDYKYFKFSAPKKWFFERWFSTDYSPNKRDHLPFSRTLPVLMRFTEKILDELVRVVDEEKIDLIIYDSFAVHAKWLTERLENNYRNARSSTRLPPPAVMVSTMFLASTKAAYPNAVESGLVLNLNIRKAMTFVWLYIKTALFCWRLGFKIVNPYSLLLYHREELNVCCTFPEFHPRSYRFEKSIFFAGSFIAEEVRTEGELGEPMSSFLKTFDARNPFELDQNLRVTRDTWHRYKNNVLIYASLGTIFNQDMTIFRLLIQAFVEYMQHESKNTTANISLLISSGAKSYSSIVEFIESMNLDSSIRQNILVMQHVPQIDVLKRASLFITHSGMNSTSEAIHYGCPMLCLPISADQPLVAYRAADELGLGIRLDIKTITKAAVVSAISRILSDDSYLERVLVFSKLSRKYKGTVNSADLIIKYLQTKKIASIKND